MKHLNWVEINKENLQHNIAVFRELIGNQRKLCCVIKSNAYGHGLVGIAKIIAELNQEIWLGVNSIDEALLIRNSGIENVIIILGYVPLARLKEAVEIGARMVVYNLETIKKLGELTLRPALRQKLRQGERVQGKKINVHIKVETGTGRQGVLTEDLLDFIIEIKKWPNIEVEGLSTHFANIEDATNHDYAKGQLEAFNNAVNLLEKNNINIAIKHTACTAATILFPETYFNMARIGIGLYGLWPSKETFVSATQNPTLRLPLIKGRVGEGFCSEKIDLKPVLTWKTRIAQIKKMKAGDYISYGCTEKLDKDSLVAVLPTGYYDGYDRKLSGVGNVLIGGKRAKILGRICMNMFMADVSDIDGVKLEDGVVLLGKQGDEEITVEEIADKIGTINYEVVTRINPLLPREYV